MDRREDRVTRYDAEPRRSTVNNGTTVHYAPGDRALCGSDCLDGALTENPDDVTGCADCLEMAAEDLADDNEYMGHCLHCRREVAARGGAPPLSSLQGGRVVRRSGISPKNRILKMANFTQNAWKRAGMTIGFKLPRRGSASVAIVAPDLPLPAHKCRITKAVHHRRGPSS